MQITYTYKIRGGCQRLYAVGDLQAVTQAIHNTFANHEMPIHSEKDQVVSHYPGGWLDRASTAVNEFYCAGGISPQTDHCSIRYRTTNNPLVATVLVTLYHKTGWLRDAKVQRRIKRFYDAFGHEFRNFDIPLVSAEHWRALVDLHPQLRCSPVWRTETGILEEIPEDWAFDPETQFYVIPKKPK